MLQELVELQGSILLLLLPEGHNEGYAWGAVDRRAGCRQQRTGIPSSARSVAMDMAGPTHAQRGRHCYGYRRVGRIVICKRPYGYLGASPSVRGAGGGLFGMPTDL